MKQFLKQLYLNNFLFYCLMGIITLFVVSYLFPSLYNACWYLLFVLLVFFLIDILLLFGFGNKIEATRSTPEKLSNGDENPIVIKIKNKYTFPIHAKIIDEIPT